VLAIDKDPNRVQEIKDKVTQAVVADATDIMTLETLGIKQMDAAVVCVGSVLSDSILTTLNLKDIGVKRVLAKSVSESHGRVLHKIGASEVFFPEKDMANSLAERLHNPNILDYLPFLEGHSIIELIPPKGLVGKTLKALNLINRYGVQVLAIKGMAQNQLSMIPTGEYVLKDGDILILLGPNDKLDLLREKEK
jgi:trk system potassium uptake protein